MSYYFFPYIITNYDIHELLCYEDREITDIDCVINVSLNTYINQAKTMIDNRQTEWTIYKKYTNQYEYIHTPVPNTKYSVCKLNPLSRSFYKMIEICRTLKLLDYYPTNNFVSFHFAEGPGGFIEAIKYLRDNLNDKYYGMTLIDKDNLSIPGWKKSADFLNDNPNIKLWYGKTGNGDILNCENLIECYNQFHSKCQFVTGDGGFDFTSNFKNQETVSLKLSFAQCAYAFACQKKGGDFILKLFDTYTQASIDLLYILSSVYEKILIFKPYTSRQANSEKYIICKNFKFNDTKEIVYKMHFILKSYREDKYPYRFLNCSIPYRFICSIQEINAILGQSQLENITSTIHLIDLCLTEKIDERLELLKRNNIIKCINWCQKFKLQYNKFLNYNE